MLLVYRDLLLVEFASMNTSDLLDQEINRSPTGAFSNDTPPGAVWGWPGCSYPLPLPPRGPYAQVSEWVWRIVPLVLILIGTVGNIVTAVVIFRNFRKLSSTAVYLVSLAFTDTLFMYSAPLIYFVLHVFEIDIRNLSSSGCKVLTFIACASFHSSAWILVAVTVERAVSVIWPYKVKRRCTERNAMLVTVTIVTMIIAMDSHLLYGFGVSPAPIYEGVNKCMPTHEAYFKFYINQWYWIHLTCGFATPLVAIVTGNMLVIHGLRKMQISQHRMNSGTPCEITPRMRQRRQAKMLMVVLILLNTIFFISQTPLAIYLVYLPQISKNLNQLACSDISKYMRDTEKLRFWEAITLSFAFLNASVNFILYVVSGSRFRKQVVSLLLCRSGFQGRSSMRYITYSEDGSVRKHRDSKNVYYVN